MQLWQSLRKCCLINWGRVLLGLSQNGPFFVNFLLPEKIVRQESKDSVTATCPKIYGNFDTNTCKFLTVTISHGYVLNIENHQGWAIKWSNRSLSALIICIDVLIRQIYHSSSIGCLCLSNISLLVMIRSTSSIVIFSSSFGLTSLLLLLLSCQVLIT